MKIAALTIKDTHTFVPSPPLRPEVQAAFTAAYHRLSATEIQRTRVAGVLLGRTDAFAVAPRPGASADGRPTAIVIRASNDVSDPGDPNKANVFYVRYGKPGIGANVDLYGPFPLHPENKR